jgi:hypothetical protein
MCEDHAPAAFAADPDRSARVREGHDPAAVPGFVAFQAPYQTRHSRGHFGICWFFCWHNFNL